MEQPTVYSLSVCQFPNSDWRTKSDSFHTLCINLWRGSKCEIPDCQRSLTFGATPQSSTNSLNLQMSDISKLRVFVLEIRYKEIFPQVWKLQVSALIIGIADSAIIS